MHNIFSLLLFLSLISASQMQEEDLTKISISTGALRGRKVVTSSGVTAYLFHGIPFAEPPIGDLRYRVPVPKKKWNGELDATKHRSACMSTRNFLRNVGETSEDCLHTNVFTTEVCLKEKNCPVMYYIFGGAFNNNSPFTLDETILIENYNSKDIILVTVTYRMNSFGFFNTGKQTSAIKNLSFHDLLLGLEWTQREIYNFGGDKNRVTIMGHSSGSISTDLIALSPKSAGLFQQVVPMSGPAGTVNLQADTNIAASRALAVETGCATEEQWDSGDSFEDIISCMRKIPIVELIAAQNQTEGRGQVFNGPALDGPGGILPEDVQTLLSKRRPYRMLIGVTDREFRNSENIVDKDGNINKQLLLATCVTSAKNRGFKHPVAVGRACFDDYSKRPSDIADLTDDITFYLPTYESGAAMRRKGATVYTYSFEYRDIGGAFGNFVHKQPGKASPYHAEDTVYIMGLNKGTFTEKDHKIQELYGGVFADFIKTGDPTPPNYPRWEPTDDRNNYFRITFDENMRMPGNTNGFHASAIQFWLKTAPEVDKYYSDRWDNDDGSINYKKVAQDLVKGLQEMQKNINPDTIKEIEEWKDSLDEEDRERLERVEEVFQELLRRILDDDDDFTFKRYSQEWQINQLVHGIMPSVRNQTTTLNTKSATWRMWFWVATGVCIVLAVMLFVTCCNSYRQYAKRRHYERLSETTRLIPSSSKLY